MQGPTEFENENTIPTLEAAYLDYMLVRKLKSNTRYGYAQCYRKLATWHQLPITKLTKSMIQQKH